MRDNQLLFLKYGMLLLNIGTCMSVAVLIYLTSWSICSYNIAREFIETAKKIPCDPHQMVWIVIILLTVLVISFALRETYAERELWGFITISIDLAVSIALILALNFNYNGLVLWVFSNALFFIKPIKGQYMMMIMAVICFLGTDYKLISIRMNLFSIQDYIAFYEADIQQILLLLYNLSISVNMVLFILFCACVIQKQQGRIEEVNILYQKLSLANEELKDANERMKKYAAMQEKMGETKERNRLAREIHDTLGHTLTGLSAGIDACIAMIDRSKDATKQHLIQLAEVSRMGLQDIRRSVSQLRPDALEGFQLEEAVQQMITRVNATTNTTIRLFWNVKQSDFDEDEEDAVYRVIQESITNAIRHGHATRVRVTAEKKDGAMIVTIHDNGMGCTNITKGFGLHHMEERIAMLNGQVMFQSDDGFTVTARIPIRWGRSNGK